MCLRSHDTSLEQLYNICTIFVRGSYSPVCANFAGHQLKSICYLTKTSQLVLGTQFRNKYFFQRLQQFGKYSGTRLSQYQLTVSNGRRTIQPAMYNVSWTYIFHLWKYHHYGLHGTRDIVSIYPSVLWICSLLSAFVCDLKGIILGSPKHRIPSSRLSPAWIHTPGRKTLLYFITANRNPRDILQTPQNNRQAWSKLCCKWTMIYSSLRINSVSRNRPQRGQNGLWLARTNCRWRLTIGQTYS